MKGIRLVVLALVVIVAFLAVQQAFGARPGEDYRTRNERVIRHVFGRYGDQAVRVAKCESGLSEWARNGQYLGLFQMGSSERRIYGHGNNPWAQSRSARAYFFDSGRDWSPWSCKPW